MTIHGPADDAQPLRGGIMTFSAIGILAGTLADITHEVLGHVTTAWLVGDPIVSIETVAIRTARASRVVDAAGTNAQLLVGAIALLLFGRTRRQSNWTLFLWMFAAFNLLGSAYVVCSGLFQFGDWAAPLLPESGDSVGSSDRGAQSDVICPCITGTILPGHA